MIETPISGSSESPVLPRIREIAGIIAGTGGVFVVLFWLAGRYYAAGYFSAMGIRSFQVSFSVWEYAEASWFPLVIYSIVTVAVGSFATGVILAIFNPLLARLVDWLRERIQRRVTKKSDFIRSHTNRMFYVAYLAVVVGSITFVVFLSLSFVYSWGRTAGRLAVLELSNEIEIVSDRPQALGVSVNSSFVVDNQDRALFVYGGFRLLTYNDGKYYLFKDIDPLTCKPKEVYVVDDKQYLQVNIFPATSLSSQCSTASGGNPQ